MATTTKADEAYTVLDGFYGKIGNEERMFRAGDLVRPDDPAVKKWPHLFGRAKFPYDAPVEQATAAPGERRNA